MKTDNILIINQNICTYSMIHTPHENRQQWLIGTEQLNLLSFHSNVFLLKLAESPLYYTHSYSELLR